VTGELEEKSSRKRSAIPSERKTSGPLREVVDREGVLSTSRSGRRNNDARREGNSWGVGDFHDTVPLRELFRERNTKVKRKRERKKNKNENWGGGEVYHRGTADPSKGAAKTPNERTRKTHSKERRNTSLKLM